jgi:hypothetical protein
MVLIEVPFEPGLLENTPSKKRTPSAPDPLFFWGGAADSLCRAGGFGTIFDGGFR